MQQRSLQILLRARLKEGKRRECRRREKEVREERTDERGKKRRSGEGGRGR
jgi:hypothetical protein